MNLYEVVFWGSRGDADAEDTLYLVRAPDYRCAVLEVSRKALPGNHGGRLHPTADLVFELGAEAASITGEDTQILRGPYFDYAYNRGWRSWERRADSSGHPDEWEEKPVPPSRGDESPE